MWYMTLPAIYWSLSELISLLNKYDLYIKLFYVFSFSNSQREEKIIYLISLENSKLDHGSNNPENKRQYFPHYGSVRNFKLLVLDFPWNSMNVNILKIQKSRFIASTLFAPFGFNRIKKNNRMWFVYMRQWAASQNVLCSRCIAGVAKLLDSSNHFSKVEIFREPQLNKHLNDMQKKY